MVVQPVRIQLAFFQQRGQPVGNEPAMAIAMFDPARPAADDRRIQRALPWSDAASVTPLFDIVASVRNEIASVFNDRFDPPDDVEHEEIAGRDDALFIFDNDGEKLMPARVQLLDRIPEPRADQISAAKQQHPVVHRLGFDEAHPGGAPPRAGSRSQ